MKKLILLILAIFVLLPLSARYSPSFTLNAGVNTLFYKNSTSLETYYSVRTGFEVSLISYKIDCVTLSIPVSVSNMTRSTTKGGLLSPSYFKNGIGFEALVERDRIGGSLALFYGYEHFTEMRGIMKYIETRAGFHLNLASYLSLVVPLSWTYTPEGNEVGLSVALRIGGEI